MERISDVGERQYTLQELASSAGVSIRTIRYYIGEGLLPGPEGAGPQSHYTESHVQRLRAIGLLKDRYLPLREIRRQLTGLDDEAIGRLITDLSGSDLDESYDPAEPPSSAPIPMAMDERSAPQIAESPPKYNALDYIDTVLNRPPRRDDIVRERSRRDRAPARDEGETWRRIEVADGVELLVREDVYQRRQDRIEWLIDWAEKVVD